MFKSMFNNPISSNILEQAFTDITKAVTAEETALSNILNLTNDIIQRAKNGSVNLEEFVSINEYVNNIIKNITKIQLMNQIKLQHMENLIQKIEDLNENDSPDE